VENLISSHLIVLSLVVSRPPEK